MGSDKNNVLNSVRRMSEKSPLTPLYERGDFDSDRNFGTYYRRETS